MNQTTLLLVGHGSREPSGNQEIEDFAQAWRAQRPQWRIEVCFIEFSATTLERGLDAAAQGTQRVLVLPLILNAAGHAKMDIPQALDAARARHGAVRFAYVPPLSACDPLLAVMLRRLQTAMQALDMPDPHTTGVVLLGRGSSDRQANGEMAKMARWVQEESGHPLVDLAFTGITHPRLEGVVQRQVRLGMTQVVVLVYYLFDGTLVQRIERQVQHLRTQYPTLRVVSTRYFGFEPEVLAVLEQRVFDALHGHAQALIACDGCSYRAFAQANGLGGHTHDDHDHPHGGHDHEHDHHHDHDHEHLHTPAPKRCAHAHTAAACTRQPA